MVMRDKASSHPLEHSLPIVFNAAILGFIGLTCLVNILQAKNIEDVNFNYGLINTWILNALNRKCRVLEGLLGMLTGILIHNNATSNTDNESHLVHLEDRRGFARHFRNDSPSEAEQKNCLMTRKPRHRLLGGAQSSTIHSLQPSWEPTSIVTLHDSYRCGSAQFLMEFFRNVINAYELDWGQTHGIIGNSEAGHMIHLLDEYLLPQLLEIDEAFGELVQVFRSNFIESHQLYIVGAILLQALVVVLIVWYHRTIVGCYNVLLALLRRVPPAHVIASEPLEQYLLATSSGKKRV
jgi:hypothetical protein